jgi:hypothetical protein
MTGIEQIQAILAQYAKHGWSLRRVLLSAKTKENLPTSLFGNAEIFSSNFDALWFARASSGEREAWELRYLSETPFALVEVFEADDEEEIREEARSEMETRLAELASKFGNRKVQD